MDKKKKQVIDSNIKAKKSLKHRQKTLSLDKIYIENKESIEKVQELLLSLKEKYGLSYEDLLSLVKREEIEIPLSIFSREISSLELITKYLKENLKFSYHEISILLARDERNTWHTYNNASKKYPKSIVVKPSKYSIPVSLFKDKKLSVLETIVHYLRTYYKLTLTEISVLLKRDVRTIWTIYERAKKKNAR